MNYQKKTLGPTYKTFFSNQWIGRVGIWNVTENVGQEFGTELLGCFPNVLAGG